MRRVEWAWDYSGGGRGIETPFFRRRMHGIVGKIGDFGVRSDGDVCSTPDMQLDPACEVSCFDSNPFIMPGDFAHYRSVPWNFLYDPRAEIPEYIESLDVATSISTIEHLSVKVYGNEEREGDDFIAVKNIFSLVKTGGFLLLSVPLSARDFIHPCGWIRSYCRETIEIWALRLACPVCLHQFQFVPSDRQWYEVEVIDPSVVHDGDIYGVIVAEFTKPEGTKQNA